jgi:hypothetical protein
MKSYQMHSTANHQQHQKEIQMNYNEQKEFDAINEEAQMRKDELIGLTARAKKLKLQISKMSNRTNGLVVGNASFTYDPRDARRKEQLAKVRDELMADNTAYFGNLDHKIVRKSYEYESLNDRQKRAIISGYRWMYEELVTEDIPALKNDVWYTPLQLEFDKLSDKEKSHFTPAERMVLLLEELEGVGLQPTFTDKYRKDSLEVKYTPTILEV